MVQPFEMPQGKQVHHKMARRTVILMILDGLGIGDEDESNPIHSTDLPTIKWLSTHYPVASLQASGISVGLPWGETGNSEVGHLTIGAGKVIYQYYPRITMAIQDGSFFEIEALKKACMHAKQNNSALNLVGLLSKGNVHSSVEHLEGLITLASREGISNVNLHLFADGKDSAPRSLNELLNRLPKERIATLVGRYYAMDREENWTLTKEAYELMIKGGGTELHHDALPTIAERTYEKGLTEEFLPPFRFGGAERMIRDNDAVLFFNYREDSIRQLAESFINPEFEKFPVQKFENLFVATMTRYKDEFKVPVAFPPEFVTDPLGKVIAESGKIQLRLAETYKYAHVTYFFNGYHEPPFKNEYRVLIPSEPIAHPDLHPQMMAPAITDRLLEALQEGAYDFILVNYANPDTIAHSGNYHAAQDALRVIDAELERILKAVHESSAILVITSDHGNVEEMLNPKTGRPETQHDPNPVPLYLVGNEFEEKKFLGIANIRRETAGILSDVAPTILELMELSKPKEMTGSSLLKNLG